MDSTIKDVCGATYVSNFLKKTPENLDPIKKELLELPWQTKRTARHEYFMSYNQITYAYGSGNGQESYTSEKFSPIVGALCGSLNAKFRTQFNACFLNKYDNEHQHLGWHADDFVGMRQDQPIMVMSFGAEREIWVKDKRGFPCPECARIRADNPLAVVAPIGHQYITAGCVTCLESEFVKSPPSGKQPEDQRVKLEEGSLFIMPIGYQDTHFHRIPKHDRPCGWRISLTFRSFNPQ